MESAFFFGIYTDFTSDIWLVVIDYLFMSRVEVVCKQQQEEVVFCTLLRRHYTPILFPYLFLLWYSINPKNVT